MCFIPSVNKSTQTLDVGTCAESVTHRLNIKPGVPGEESLCGPNKCLDVQYSHCYTPLCD